MVSLAQGFLGKMNVDFEESYDEESDVYYVTFKTGEPSYCLEVDDIILIELGMFSNQPTGFRILNFNKNRVDKVEFSKDMKKLLSRALSPVESQSRSAFTAKAKKIEERLEEVLA